MALSKITNLSITDDAVRTVGIKDDNVTTAKILDNNVTLAKLGDGTQGDILYYGASGAPARLGFGTSGDFLKTQGTGANPAWAAAGGGKVLQVQSTCLTTTWTYTDPNWQDITGMSVDITPAATANKILVWADLIWSNDGAGAQSFRIVRDSTAISIGTSTGSRVPVSSLNPWDAHDEMNTHQGSVTHLDSPSSTSAVTYKLQAISMQSDTSVTWCVNRSFRDLAGGSDEYDTRGASNITVMEIDYT